MYGSREKVKIELIKGTNLVLVTLIMKMENVTENVIASASAWYSFEFLFLL